MLDAARARTAYARLTVQQRIWFTILALTLPAVAVFAAFPGIDLATSSLFTDANRQFWLKQNGVVTFARSLLSWIFTAACVLSIAGLIMTRTWRRRWLSLSFAQWLFFGACLGAGPGLVANLGWKDHWGRARPATVTEFGGERTFTPILTQGTQCPRNCSFVSGEASSMFMLFFAAAFLFPSLSRTMWGAGILFGFLAGLLRMVQGGHFLSDVIFAGLFMAMTAAALDYAFRAVAATGPHRDESADA